MAALIERDETAALEVAGNPIPVSSVGAESVKEEHWRVVPCFPFRRPLDVMEADATSLEPTVGRFPHRL
jgi:hypothetical protein